MTLSARLAYTCARMQPPNNLLARYAEQSGELEHLIASVQDSLITRRPSEDRWSILEIVGHLADAELLASVRIRRIITQDRPRLWGYKQEDWANLLNYRQLRIGTLLGRFALLRRENAELIKDLPGKIWAQSGTHDDYGVLSLSQLIEDYIAHTARHLDQVKSVAAEIIGRDRMKGIDMAKTQEKSPQLEEVADIKNKDAKSKKDKALKDKNGKALVGRVKKVLKKSRRKLGDEKFEKELQRTIAFLEGLQLRMAEAGNGASPNKPEKKSKSGKKDNSKAKAKKATKKDKYGKVQAEAGIASSVQVEPTAISE